MGYDENFKKVLLGEPHAILGKNGITEEFIAHILKLLKRFKIIKIKALKTVATKSNIKELAYKLCTSTDSYLLDIRGKTFIISKYQINKKV
jgi:RNA-binding protein YhbY